MSSKGWASCFLGILLLAASCSQQRKPTPQQELGRFKTYTGTLDVYADAGLEPVLKQQMEVFQFYYDSVRAIMHYSDEADAINAYRKSKKGVLVLCREIDSTEQAGFQRNDTLYIRQLPVAYDAVALIANKKFDDKGLDISTLKKYFSSANKSDAKPTLVFDKQSSSVVKFMLDALGIRGTIPANVFAAKMPADVVEYVAENENAIGLIPFNFLSDTDNERVRKINERIKILSLHAKDSTGRQVAASANQSDIADKTYPFIRTITAITHYGYDDDLDWLLVYFLSKDKGSKIFLKDGLIPVKRTEREIIVNTEGLKAGSR